MSLDSLCSWPDLPVGCEKDTEAESTLSFLNCFGPGAYHSNRKQANMARPAAYCAGVTEDQRGQMKLDSIIKLTGQGTGSKAEPFCNNHRKP